MSQRGKRENKRVRERERERGGRKRMSDQRGKRENERVRERRERFRESEREERE